MPLLRRWLLVTVLVLMAAGIGAIAWGVSIGITPEMLQGWISRLGIWAPIGFVALYAVATVGMVPGGIFDLAGGAMFGPYLGGWLNLAGGTLGAVLGFLLARYLARDWAEARAGPRLQSIMRSVDREGWRFVAFVRLVPVFPYNILNYLLGLTRIPFHHYVIATVIFMAPSTVAYTYLGHAGRALVAGDEDTIYYALVALGVLAALLVLPRFLMRMRKAEAGQ
jgi:uncharacterized membrane protein YdjX (TVP38/TMEM64 family)